MPNFTDKIVLRKNGIDTFYEIANFIKGYLNTTNNKFYKESTFLTEIEGIDRKIYLDLNTNYLYKFNADSSTPGFVQIGGGGSGGSYTPGFGINISNLGVIKTTDFVGTQAEWDALTTTEKEAYDFVHITDDVANGGAIVVDTIADGNMNPCTSNSVYQAITEKNKLITILAENSDIDISTTRYQTTVSELSNLLSIYVRGYIGTNSGGHRFCAIIPVPIALGNLDYQIAIESVNIHDISLIVNLTTSGSLQIGCTNQQSNKVALTFIKGVKM